MQTCRTAILWIFLCGLPSIVKAQFAVIAADAHTTVVSDYPNDRLLIIQPDVSLRTKALKLPYHLKDPSNYGVGTNRLAIDALGKHLYWQYGQEVWQHALERGKPIGDWKLIYEHPRALGRLLGFKLHPHQAFMVLQLEVDRRHLKDPPNEGYWSCRTAMPIDLTKSGAYPGQLLLLTDSTQLDQIWILDEWNIIAHYRNERTAQRKLQLYQRRGSSDWIIGKDDIFPGYIPQGYTSWAYSKIRILLNPWHTEGQPNLAQLTQRASGKNGSGIVKPQWYFNAEKDSIRLTPPDYPTIPDADRFSHQIAPNGNFVVGSRTSSNSDHQRNSTLIIPTSFGIRHLTGFSSYEHTEIKVEGHAYFGQLSNRFGIVLRPISNGRRVEISLIDWYSQELELIHRTEEN